MADRIDHAAIAHQHLQESENLLAVEEFAHADLAIKTATVHASLAVAEQQRIANIIAVGYHNVNAAGEDVWGDSFTLRDDIRKGLGL